MRPLGTLIDQAWPPTGRILPRAGNCGVGPGPRPAHKGARHRPLFFHSNSPQLTIDRVTNSVLSCYMTLEGQPLRTFHSYSSPSLAPCAPGSALSTLNCELLTAGDGRLSWLFGLCTLGSALSTLDCQLSTARASSISFISFLFCTLCALSYTHGTNQPLPAQSFTNSFPLQRGWVCIPEDQNEPENP